MKTFLIELKVRRCEEVFAPDLGPGILASEEVSFNDDEERQRIMLLSSLRSHCDRFVEKYIEVQITELE